MPGRRTSESPIGRTVRMLGARVNYCPDGECNLTTLSSPPYTTMSEGLAACLHSGRSQRLAPTRLSGRTNIQTVSCDGSLRRISSRPGTAVARGSPVGVVEAVVDTEKLVVPERSELQYRFRLT